MSTTTNTQQQIIAFLANEPGAHTRRVAGELGIRSQDAGRNLAALERQQLVEFVVGGQHAGWYARLSREWSSTQ